MNEKTTLVNVGLTERVRITGLLWRITEITPEGIKTHPWGEPENEAFIPANEIWSKFRKQ